MQHETMPGPRRGWHGHRRRRFAVFGPLVLLVLVVVGTLGASRAQPEARDVDAIALALVAAGPLALLRVTRSPRGVLGFVTAATIGYLALDYPFGPVFASFVAAAVVNTVLGHRRTAWAATGLLVACAVALQATVRDDGITWGWAIGVTAWAAIVVVFGELIRVRRAGLAAAGRARAESERRRAGEERLRIARELHDVVAHHMSLINVQASVALHLVDRKPEQVEAALSTIKDASKEALTELRSLIGVLRADGEAAPRAPIATLTSLDSLLARTRQAGVAVTAEVNGDMRTVPPGVDLASYRIIQEALTNVVRHSGAQTATISVDIGAESAAVVVEDTGRGPGAAPSGSEPLSGSGIIGMTERAEALGGTLAVRRADGGGTRVEARFPIGDGS